jgi:hypothetical protein
MLLFRPFISTFFRAAILEPPHFLVHDSLARPTTVLISPVGNEQVSSLRIASACQNAINADWLFQVLGRHLIDVHQLAAAYSAL